LSGYVQPQIGQGITPYQGQRVADVTGLQQSAFDTAGGLSPVAQTALQAAGGQLGAYDPLAGTQYLQQGGDALSSMLKDYNPQAAQDYWQQSFVNPALKTYEQDIVPVLQEQLALSNAKSSGAVNQSIERSGADLMGQLSSQLGNLLYNDRNSYMNRQQQAVNQAGQYAQLPGQLASQGLGIAGMGSDLLGALYNMGSAQRGIGQEQLTADQSMWAEAQPWNNPIVSNFLPMALSEPGMQPVVNQSSGMGSSLGSALGTALGGMLPGLGSFLSGGLGSMLGGGGGMGMTTSYGRNFF
jgi:hypothetical protein